MAIFLAAADIENGSNTVAGESDSAKPLVVDVPVSAKDEKPSIRMRARFGNLKPALGREFGGIGEVGRKQCDGLFFQAPSSSHHPSHRALVEDRRRRKARCESETARPC